MGNLKLMVRDKLIITVVNIIFIASIEKGRYPVLALFGVLSIIVMILFKPDYRKLPKRVFLVFLYPLSISLFIPFTAPGNILNSLNLRLFTVTVTDNGLATFYTVLAKSFLSIVLIASLILSTEERDLFYGLRKIKVPNIIVSIMFLMYRYVFLIREETKTGQMAINSRIFKKSYYAENKRLAYLMGNMLIKSFGRAENIYKSMESRGFTGDFYIYQKPTRSAGVGIAFLITFIIVPTSLKIIEIVKVI